MRALLERWAKVEPERCAWIEGVMTLKFARTILVPDDFPLDKLDRAKLLAAVIEAIEARGLNWRIERDGGTLYREPDYCAEIDDGLDEPWEHLADGNTPAAALLSAYLAAIEALS